MPTFPPAVERLDTRPRWTTPVAQPDRIAANPPGDPPGVVMSGELDMASAPLLCAAVTAAARAVTDPPGAAVRFLLDLTDVQFMDIHALRALADIHAEITGRGWILGFTPPAAPGPRRLLFLAAGKGWLPRW